MVTQFIRDKPEQNLPDAYRKNSDSNNAKLLGIECDAVRALSDAVNAIYDSLDIDKAYGKTLDLYGDMVSQARGKATDEQYRILIKNQITRNFCNGDYNSLMSALCVTFNCNPSDISLVEPEEPCRLRVEGLPIAKLNESNIDITTAILIVQNLVPVGVQLESISFSGTFEFSGGTTLEYDAQKGFADDAQSIGGYLGLVGGSTPNSSGQTSSLYTAVLGKASIGRMILGKS